MREHISVLLSFKNDILGDFFLLNVYNQKNWKKNIPSRDLNYFLSAVEKGELVKR